MSIPVFLTFVFTSRSRRIVSVGDPERYSVVRVGALRHSVTVTPGFHNRLHKHAKIEAAQHIRTTQPRSPPSMVGPIAIRLRTTIASELSLLLDLAGCMPLDPGDEVRLRGQQTRLLRVDRRAEQASRVARIRRCLEHRNGQKACLAIILVGDGPASRPASA